MKEILRRAFQNEDRLRFQETNETCCLFFGPGETDHDLLKEVQIERFLDHLWITHWATLSSEHLQSIAEMAVELSTTPVTAVVAMDRSSVASTALVKPVLGTPRPGRFQVREHGVPYLVQMSDTKHPGLFLDHAPLRKTLLTRAQGRTTLNLFAYTGSLSLASGFGGAPKVFTLDLSKATLQWAQENWTNAGLPPERGEFISGDVLEWLPRFSKKQMHFDLVLCDPPSFSRSKGRTFSTQKDLISLHEGIFSILKPGGTLATSINSEKISEREFLAQIRRAADLAHAQVEVEETLRLPPTYGRILYSKASYLKGFIINRIS